MSSPSLSDLERRRLQILGAVTAFALAVLLLALWTLQMGRGAQFQSSLERQSLRRVRVPGLRGRIVDRAGVCLADNAPAFGIALCLEDLRPSGRWRRTADEAWALVQRIAAQIGQPPQTDPAAIAEHLATRRALPLVAWPRVDNTALARLAESPEAWPGVDLVVGAERVYPLGATFSHSLGYVGPSDPGDNEAEPYHYVLPAAAGRAGLEQQYDALLAGQAGQRLVRVDVAGFKHEEYDLRAPTAGSDLMLTIDALCQQAAERALDGARGALVALDPRQGDVLAIASAPGFDPNLFCRRLSPAEWRGMRDDPARPLFHRAVSGAYPPGSTIKPLTAMAALTAGADPDLQVDCPGHFDLGPQRFACYQNTAHGPLGLRRALQVSCNVFFYRFALLCGYDPLYHMAEAVGLGAKTGIGLQGEAAGLLPGKAWKRQVRGEGWRDGDTCNVAIGQGDLLVTPLQMAVLTAALANGGRVFRPRLVRATRPAGASRFVDAPPAPSHPLAWNARHLALVTAGLRDVVATPDGTGRLAAIPGTAVAGKTGTAEYGRKGSGRQYGWMIAYAPGDAPRVAAALVIEDATSGGGAAAGPRLGAFLRAALDRPPPPPPADVAPRAAPHPGVDGGADEEAAP